MLSDVLYENIELDIKRKRALGGCLGINGDEGRDSLRKATGNWQEVLIRGCPNGGTHNICCIVS